MILINFSHPLTPAQVKQLEARIGAAVERVIAVPAQFDIGQPFVPQVAALLAQVPLTAEEWQTTPLLIVPPALNFITAALLAELHGRMGYFPAIVRLRPVAESVPPRFEVAEVINLQAVREAARIERSQKMEVDDA
ncbi:MAG: hypothetical protein QG637_1682 [Chloroflexota bacterium]|nr:hypothetical protein [Chloroflexota bacterium]